MPFIGKVRVLFKTRLIFPRINGPNKSIRGFSLGNDEVKISQYADDTTHILDGSENSLTSAIQILRDFNKISGSKLNDSKAEALWIVFKIGHEQILVSGKTFKSPKYKVKTRSVAVN